MAEGLITDVERWLCVRGLFRSHERRWAAPNDLGHRLEMQAEVRMAGEARAKIISQQRREAVRPGSTSESAGKNTTDRCVMWVTERDLSLHFQVTSLL